jgi:hypothetical protein
MELQTKALYTLLRLNHDQDPSIACESWQIEDLRVLPKEELFDRLKSYGLELDAQTLQRFAEECDSPEDLTELLLVEHAEPELHDRLYLLLFEIWRRLFPERQTLSIFCDEFDHRICLYDDGLLDSDELIQDALANMIEIFNQNSDAGAEPAEILESVNSHCAHDVMNFLIEYISELLDNGNELYASELIEHFAPYTQEAAWFDFLRVRLSAFSDPVSANHLLGALLEEKEAMSLDLLMEMLRFQTVFGERPVFMEVVQQMLPLVQVQEEFVEMIELAADYFRRRDRDDLEQAVLKLLEDKKDYFDPDDLKALERILAPLVQLHSLE